ncbi:NB-ARC domain-containing protein [Capilliphycus salinus ALCB114379]|uniref:WD40 domain-containing protein n=1 Tax=Capilliphycus salinus TaxID=2768948 RepID=UPI0039A6A894
MEFDKALEAINGAFSRKNDRLLTEVEIALIYGAWNNLTYDRIAERSGYSVNYLQRDVGPKFWKLLSKALDRKVNKTTLRAILSNQKNPLPHRQPEKKQTIDWGEAPDVSYFQGRQDEIEQLTQCITEERCRLVAIVGQGGIGKSSLAAKVARQVQADFDFVIWRSLRNAPSLETLLAELVPLVSAQKDIQTKPERLLYWLQTHRCLVILDNQETLLQAGKEGGYYQPQFANYGDLVQMLGEANHQSCILLTSREKSTNIGLLENSRGAVRLLALKGSWEASLALIEAKRLVGTEDEKRRLCKLYRCNPLALKIVGTSIQSLFEGEIAAFFESETPIFNGIRRLLDQQFERLSPLEQTLMNWLAINREWTAIPPLQSDIVPAITRPSLLEALESLTGRSLIEKRVLKEKGKSRMEYTQQPVVMEYVTKRLIRQLAAELTQKETTSLRRYALMKTTVPHYIRESQIRVIINPLIAQLQEGFHHDSQRLEQHLRSLLANLRDSAPIGLDYGTGNLINLCLHLSIDLTGYNFSHLTIRHADLQGATLQRVNFQSAQFVESTFTETFAGGMWVGFSPDGQRFAIGDSNGGLHLWQFEPMQPLAAIRGEQQNWLMAAAWHPNGTNLAFGVDQTVKLWDTRTGRLVLNFEGNTPWVFDLAWSPDGKYLACGGQETSIKVWDRTTETCLKCLRIDETNQQLLWTQALEWLAGGTLLAGGYMDHTIKFWNVASGECIRVIQAHDYWISSLTLHPNGEILASSSYDKTVKLWNWRNGNCLKVISTSDVIYKLAWSADGNKLAGGSFDCTITLWDTDLQCTQILQGHQNWVWGLAWKPDSKSLISVSQDPVLKLWNTQTGDCIKTIKGYSNSSRSMKWSKDGIHLLSGSTDHSVQLWDTQTGECLRRFRGHQNEVLCVAWSPDENRIVSSSADTTIRIWNVHSKQCITTLRGHLGCVRSVAWSHDGSYLISCADDETVKLWDAISGQCLLTLSGHQNKVNAVAWFSNGKRVASGSMDGTIRVWDLNRGVCDRVIQVGHLVHPIAFSPDGKTLASGDFNNTVNLWDMASGERLKTFQIHSQGNIFSISWNESGTKLANACNDSTVIIWNVNTGECENLIQGSNHGMAVDWHPTKDLLAIAFLEQPIQLWDRQTQKVVKTLRSDRPYEGMNIVGTTGISEAQKVTLQALGAIKE